MADGGAWQGCVRRVGYSHGHIKGVSALCRSQAHSVGVARATIRHVTHRMHECDRTCACRACGCAPECYIDTHTQCTKKQERHQLACANNMLGQIERDRDQ
jgi:hypothetical protein